MKIRYLLLLLILSLTCTLQAQENNDTQAEFLVWTGFGAKYKINKKWRVDFEQQLRFENEEAIFEKTFSELGVRYEVKDWWNFKLQYRYSWINEERNNGRISLDSNLSWDLDDNPIDINYRLRIQDTKVSYTGQKITYLRNQLELDANLTKLVDPQIAYEHFYRLNNKNETRVHRLSFALTWKLNKKTDFETFYRIDKEVNTNDNNIQHIIGLMFSYDID